MQQHTPSGSVNIPYAHTLKMPEYLFSASGLEINYWLQHADSEASKVY